MATYAFMGHENVGEAVAAGLEAAGYDRAAQLADADVVVTYFLTLTELEDAYFDDDGLIQVARPGALLVDASPSTPSMARELEAVATVSDLAFAEAPIAVFDMTAPDAFLDYSNVMCWLAGEQGAVEAARQVVSTFASSVREEGGAGAAQVARAAHTLQAVAQTIAAIEAAALVEAVRHAPAGTGANVSGTARPLGDVSEAALSAVAQERFSGAFSVEMLMAELAAALETADDADLILPQAEAAQHLLELLAVIGGSDLALAALSLVYGEEAKCAEHGLDWTRAAEAFGDGSDDGDEDLDDDDDYDDYEGYRPFGYSVN